MGRPAKAPTVVVRLPKETVEQIDGYADRHGTTRSEVVRSGLDALIKLGGLD